MTLPHIVQTIAGIAENTGGPARTIRSLCTALARAGAEVELLAGHDPARADVLLTPDPALVTTRLVERRRRHGLPSYDFATALAAVDPARTIVHDNGIWNPASLAVTRAARRLRLPYVISPHGMLEPWALAYHPWRKRLAWTAYQARSFQHARGLVATAEQELRGIRRRVPAKPVAVIPNGIDCPAAVPDRSARDRPQPRTLLFLSRLHPVKNLPVLIDAWAAVAAEPAFADWTLRIAGPDELGLAAGLTAQIVRLGLDSRVRIDGAVPESAKAEAFASADLFVLPSLSENFGVVVAEALAHGVPVIATHGTPWASLVEGRCGWQVAPTVAGLKAALHEAMLLEPQARRAMGERGHALVVRSFGWDRIAAQTLAFYGWLLDGGAKPEFVDG